MHLRLRDRTVESPDWPAVMGVLNVTPDSFSDGGRYATTSEAVAAALAMVADGASIIDVGPESTRPGSVDVPCDEQIARAVPVINGIRSADASITISIDTTSAGVARAAIDAGADMINDTSALRDDTELAAVVAESGATICLMHRKGTPATMQRDGGPRYDNVIVEISQFLVDRAEFAQRAGIGSDRILIDPGIGFGKRVEDNLRILREASTLVALGYPVLIGASRKRFIGHVLGIEDPVRRDAGSLACAMIAAQAGAAVLRAHDVRTTAEAVRMMCAVRDNQPSFQNPTNTP